MIIHAAVVYRIMPPLIIHAVFALSCVSVALARFLAFCRVFALHAVKMLWRACKRVKWDLADC